MNSLISEIKARLAAAANTVRWQNREDITFLIERVEKLEKALELISKNNTDDRELYTMGCDCGEVARKALEDSP